LKCHHCFLSNFYAIRRGPRFVSRVRLVAKAGLSVLPHDLQHLEAHLINVACDDPGAMIGGQLALPLLQERLDAAALEYAAQKAAEAEAAVIQMEVRGCS
jgi:hypothetical protein